MSKIVLFYGKNRTSVGASSTQNNPFFNSNFNLGNDNVQTIRTAGVASGLYITVVSNNRGSSTFKFRKNGANGNQTITIGASTTGEFEDTTNTDSVSAGDNVNTQLLVGSGGTSFIYVAGRNFFAATSNTVTRVGCTDNDNVSTASTAFYYAVGGRYAVASTTESEELINVKTAGTFKNLGFDVNTNTRSTATTVGMRLNGSDSSLTVSVAASTTGSFENTSNSVSVAVDDTTCLFFRTGTGSGNFRAARGSRFDFETTNDKFQIFSSQSSASSAGAGLSAGTTYYRTIGGVVDNGITTETEAYTLAGLAFTSSNLQVRVGANAVSNTSTVSFRKNSTAGNQSVSIAASTTGLFQDTTNSDSVATTDEINYRYVVGSGGTTLSINAISTLGTLPATSLIKTVNGLAKASVKTVNGLAIASVKSINGLQ